MKKKLGLVKDIGKTFGLGAIAGLPGNIITSSVISIVVRGLKGEDFDLETSIRQGLIAGLSMSALTGLVNTLLQIPAIKENYEIRALEESDGIEIVDKETGESIVLR